MYKKIMVPLDGSELAECVLPHVEAFIKGFQINEVLFVRVVDPVGVSFSSESSMLEEMKEKESTVKSSAEDYLNQVVSRLKQEGTALHSEILVGRVAGSLADYAKKNDIDLILIATHGRSGVTRWVRGSVADKVLRSSNAPVLMVRAPGTEGGI
ncbi:universal stress protein [bacterium]|nr:universal stress protein [bacterium]